MIIQITQKETINMSTPNMNSEYKMSIRRNFKLSAINILPTVPLLRAILARRNISVHGVKLVKCE